jgi:hypothetical protein
MSAVSGRRNRSCLTPGQKPPSPPLSGVSEFETVEIVDRLNREINAALAGPEIKLRLAKLGGAQMPMTPTEFGKFFIEDTEKWARVIPAANIKAE